MNLLQMRQRCRSRFRDVAQQYYDDAEWNAYLNEAMQDVLNATPWWPFLERQAAVILTAGTDRFTAGVQLPDFGQVRSIYNETDKVQLAQVESARRSWREWPPTTGQGTPTRYRMVGDDIIVYPTPAQATTLAVEYTTAATTEMTNEGDVPPFPERYHRMLIDGALARAYTDDGNMEQNQAHQSRFDRFIGNMMFELLSSRDERNVVLVDDFWES